MDGESGESIEEAVVRRSNLRRRKEKERYCQNADLLMRCCSVVSSRSELHSSNIASVAHPRYDMCNRERVKWPMAAKSNQIKSNQVTTCRTLVKFTWKWSF